MEIIRKRENNMLIALLVLAALLLLYFVWCVYVYIFVAEDNEDEQDIYG